MADTFDDVLRLILDNTQFLASAAQTTQVWQQQMNSMTQMAGKSSQDIVQLLKNIEHETEKVGLTMSAGFASSFKKVEKDAAATGLTIGRLLRIGASGSAAMGEFQGASAIYGLERLAQVAGVANTQLLAIGASAIAAGAALAVMMTPLAAILVGAEFGQHLAQMSTLLDNDGESAKQFGADLDMLKHRIVDLSVRWNEDLLKTTDAFKEALSSGIGTNELEAFMSTAVMLAKATQTDMDKAVRMLTTYKDAYHLNIEQMGAISDVLFSTIDVSKMKMEEYATSIGRLIPVAAGASISIVDMNGALAALNRQGETGSQSVTSLAEFIRKVINPSKEAEKAFQSMGIQFGAAAFQGRTFSEVIEDMRAKIEKAGAGDDIYSKLFPEARAQRAAELLIRTKDQVSLVGSLTEQVGSRVGIAMDAAHKAMNNSVDAMGSAWKAFGGEFKIVGDDIVKMAVEMFGGDSNGLSEQNLNNIRIAIEKVGNVLKTLGMIEGEIAHGISSAMTAIAFAAKEASLHIQATTAVMTGQIQKAHDLTLEIEQLEFDEVAKEQAMADGYSQIWDAYVKSLQKGQAEIDRLKDKNTDLSKGMEKQGVTMGDLSKSLNTVTSLFKGHADTVDHVSRATSNLDQVMSSFQASIKDVDAASRKEIEDFVAAADTRMAKITETMAIREAEMRQEAEQHKQTRSQYLDLKEGYADLKREEANLLLAEKHNFEAGLESMKAVEKEKIKTIRDTFDKEILLLRQSDDFKAMSKDAQKQMIQEIEQKRDEAIRMELDGLRLTLSEVKRTEAEKVQAVKQGVDQHIEEIKRLELELHPKPTAAEKRDERSNLGVSGGVSMDPLGNFIKNGKGEVIVGGGGNTFGNSDYFFTKKPKQDSNEGAVQQAAAQIAANITVNNTSSPGGMTAQDIDRVTEIVRAQLQQQAQNKTGGSSYPLGYDKR